MRGRAAPPHPGIYRVPPSREFVGKDEAFFKDWLVRHGLEKLVDVFKGMFSQF